MHLMICHRCVLVFTEFLDFLKQIIILIWDFLLFKTNPTSFVNTGSDASGQQSTSKGTDGKGSASDHGPGDPASGQNQTK